MGQVEQGVAHEVREAFVTAFDLPPGTDVERLEIGNNSFWDSIGHMALVAEFEDRFGIMLETDDIVEMSSFAKSLEVLRGHGLEL